MALRTLTPYRSRIHWAGARRRAGLRAFSDHLAEDVFIERQIGYKALEARILITQLPQLADLGESELRVLLPEIKARRSLRAADAHPAPAFRFPPGPARSNLLRSRSASCSANVWCGALPSKRVWRQKSPPGSGGAMPLDVASSGALYAPHADRKRPPLCFVINVWRY